MEPLEHVIEPVSAPERRVAAGGWRRAAVGIALGVAAGALVAAVTPPDRSGRRDGSGRQDRPVPRTRTGRRSTTGQAG